MYRSYVYSTSDFLYFQVFQLFVIIFHVNIQNVYECAFHILLYQLKSYACKYLRSEDIISSEYGLVMINIDLSPFILFTANRFLSFFQISVNSGRFFSTSLRGQISSFLSIILMLPRGTLETSTWQLQTRFNDEVDKPLSTRMRSLEGLGIVNGISLAPEKCKSNFMPDCHANHDGCFCELSDKGAHTLICEAKERTSVLITF